MLVAHIEDTLAALFVGSLLGVMVTPKLVSWIAYRERSAASRAADVEALLSDELLVRMIAELRDRSVEATPDSEG